LALMVSLEFIGEKYNNNKTKVMSKALDKAVEVYLENQKSPSRKAGELDNRGSHYFLAQYWAVALAEQDDDSELKSVFSKVAKQLVENETRIMDEIMATEGNPTDIGGYYLPDDDVAAAAMRPSKTLNAIIDSM